MPVALPINLDAIQPLLTMLLQTEQARKEFEEQIRSYLDERNVIGLGVALASDVPYFTKEYNGTEEIAAAIVGLIAGDIGIELPGYDDPVANAR